MTKLATIRLLVLGALALTAPAFGQAPGGETPEKPGAPRGSTFRIQVIRLVGVSRELQSKVIALMKLRPGMYLDENLLNEDLHRIDKDGRFKYTGRTELDPKAGLLIIHLRPRGPIAGVIFRLRESQDDAFAEIVIPRRGKKPKSDRRVTSIVLEDDIRARKGGWYRPQFAQLDADDIRRKFIAKGFYEASVASEALRTGDGRLFVVFNVTRGPFIPVGRINLDLKSASLDGRIRWVLAQHPKMSRARAQRIARRDPARRKKQVRSRMRIKPRSYIAGKFFLYLKGLYDEEQFQKDLRAVEAMYQEDGYIDVKVTAEPAKVVIELDKQKRIKRKFIELNVTVDEGDPYFVREVRIEGNGKVKVDGKVAVTEQEILDVLNRDRRLKIKKGALFHFSDLSIARHRVRLLYGEKSLFLTRVRVDWLLPDKPAPVWPTPDKPAQVWPAPDKPAQVDVQVSIAESQPVRVREILIKGNTKTKDRVILNHLEQLPGERINVQKLNNSVRNLNSTGHFKRSPRGVGWNWERVENTDDEVNVTFRVRETETGRFILGIGFNSNNNFFGQFAVNQTNFDIGGSPEDWSDWTGAFVGGGQNLSLNAQIGQTRSAFQLSFSEPWMFDRPIRFSLSIRDFERVQEAWDESRTGGLVSLSRRILRNRLSLGATYEIRNVRVFDFDASTPPDVLAMKGSNLISSLGASLSWYTLDHRFVPTKGLRLRAGGSVAGGALGADHSFYKFNAEATAFVPLFHTSPLNPRDPSYTYTLQMRLRASAVNGFGSGAGGSGSSDSVPFFERSFGGGIGTIRGFDFRTVGPKQNGVPVGGKVSLLGTAEFTVPLQGNIIRAGAFFDVGNVWAEDNLVELDWGDLKKSWGVGLQILTPISPLPIKIYWAWIIDQQPGDDAQRVNFTFGLPF